MPSQASTINSSSSQSSTCHKMQKKKKKKLSVKRWKLTVVVKIESLNQAFNYFDSSILKLGNCGRSTLCITCEVSWFVRNKLTVLMSGLAVTICFSAERNLFCLNSMSPAEYWNILNGDHVIQTMSNVHHSQKSQINIWNLRKEISIQKTYMKSSIVQFETNS